MTHRTIFITILVISLVACLCLKTSQASSLRTVQLSEPKLTGPISVEQALASRRSIRRFSRQPLNLTQIGQLAWAGQGITDKHRGFRTAPSAGALYPMKLYFVTGEGVSVYNPNEHSLREILSGDIRDKLSSAALGQKVVARAACDIVIAGSERKLAVKYGNRARRYMLLEAGHIAENIQLQAVSLGLGAVPVGAFEINRVHKVCKLSTDLEPLIIICVGYPESSSATKMTKVKKEGLQMEIAKVKKAVLIIASENFRDEELFQTRDALVEAGVETATASSKTGTITGMLGGKAEADILVDDIVVDDYDAIVFIGGSGAKEYFDSEVAFNIARQAAEKQKVVAAICIAPTVLANAGLLDGVKATSYPSEEPTLKEKGAKYTGSDVEQDGLIITGIGPKAASQFGKVVAEALAGR